MRAVKTWFENLPIVRKLIAIGVLTSAAIAIASAVAIVGYDLETSRQRLERDIGLLADVVGANSTAALAFAEPGSAAEMLRSVAANDHIVSAAIVLPDGQVFGTCLRDHLQSAVK